MVVAVVVAVVALGTAGREVRAAWPWLAGLVWVLLPPPSLEHSRERGACVRVCVRGEGTKRRVREGGWGDETGVPPRCPDPLESPRSGAVGREMGGARMADSPPAAQPPAPEHLQGPERGESRSRPCWEKGLTGWLLELVGKLGTGGDSDTRSCRCSFKLLCVFTQEIKGSKAILALNYFILTGRPGPVRIPSGGCSSLLAGAPARSWAPARVTCGDTLRSPLLPPAGRKLKSGAAGSGGGPWGLGIQDSSIKFPL